MGSPHQETQSEGGVNMLHIWASCVRQRSTVPRCRPRVHFAMLGRIKKQALCATRCIASGTRVIIALLTLLVSSTFDVQAQDYPTRPIMLVVPFPAGGGNDALARAVAEKMSRTLGQQVVVENRAAGGGGTVATRAVAKAAPDGYTILLTYTGTLAVNPDALSQRRLRSAQGRGADRTDRPAAERADGASVLADPLDRGACRLRQSQSQQDRSCGFVPGTIGHMTTELFAKSAGFEVTRVPYKGNGTAIGDLIGGHITAMVLSIQTVVGNALPSPAAERSKLMPEVPTVAESALLASRRPSVVRALRGVGRHAAPDHRQAEPEPRAAVSSDDARTPGARGRRTDHQHAGGDMPPRSMPRRPSGRPSSKAST